LNGRLRCACGGGRVNHTAFIGIGSNLGDKLSRCREAIRMLSEHEETHLSGCSRFYLTEPVDYTDQDWFVNAVVRIETRLDPGALLLLLKGMEKIAGRTENAIRYGPRPLDLDILLFDDLILRLPDLEIPHPRMHKRRFVLDPMCDIDRRAVHPILKRNIAQLLEELRDTDQKVIPYRCDC
jgi:2-amino-4-hydroxy-6-hydroxymethyldihydropteridine diphosphokinase